MFQKEKERLNQILKQQYGKKPTSSNTNFDKISIYYNLVKEQTTETQVDDITWNDLDMDRIFARMNDTKCYIGEQMLYKQLHTLDHTSSDTKHLDQLIDYFSKHETERLEISRELLHIGKTPDSYHLPDFLFHADAMSTGKNWVYRILQLLLFGSLVLGIVLHQPVCFGVTFCTALVNLVIYACMKTKYESLLCALLNIKYMVSVAKKLAKNETYRTYLGADQLDTAVKELHRLTHLIGTYQCKKRSMWTADVVDIFQDYVIGMTLWDLTVFKTITKIIHGKLEWLMVLYKAIGEIDMAISIASFRASLPYHCKPQWSDKTEIFMESIYHPLLDHPISNDLNLKEPCIITGSNASGKSTFIKSVAVNAILAQTICTCTAKRYRMPPMHVMTSMTIRDDILSGESFYIRELRYLKRIVDSVSSNQITLCIIDEILRGTNTKERLAASEAILRYLAKHHCIVIVATHDMELAKALEETYGCFHFCNYYEDGKIVFDYKIKRGYNQTQNAIKLLHVIGFPKTIVQMAEQSS